jgi:hypothetical protein
MPAPVNWPWPFAPSPQCRGNRPQDDGRTLVRCDGQVIYLPDEMDLMDRETTTPPFTNCWPDWRPAPSNSAPMTWMWKKHWTGQAVAFTAGRFPEPKRFESDLSRFLRGFEDPRHGPGPVHPFRTRPCRPDGKPALIPACFAGSPTPSPIASLQARTVTPSAAPGFPSTALVMNEKLVPDPVLAPAIQAMADRFRRMTAAGNDTAETSARVVMDFYPTPDRTSAGKGTFRISPPGPAFRPPAGTVFLGAAAQTL